MGVLGSPNLFNIYLNSRTRNLLKHKTFLYIVFFNYEGDMQIESPFQQNILLK